MAAPQTKATTLFSLDAIKAWVKITASDNDTDQILVQMADGVSEFVESRTGRIYVTRSIVEVRDGNDCSTLYLRKYPVVSVASVTVQRSTLLPVETIPVGAWRVASERGAVWLLDSMLISIFTRGFQNVTVTYQAGYGAQDAVTLPQDIVEAAKEIVKLVWMEFGGNAIASSTMTFGATSITIRPDWPKQIKDTLANWRLATAL